MRSCVICISQGTIVIACNSYLQMVDNRLMFGYWPFFIPDSSAAGNSPQVQTLFTSILKDPSPKVSKTKTLHPRSAKQRPFTQGQQNKDPKTMFLQQAPRHKEVDTHLTYLCVCAQGERNID